MPNPHRNYCEAANLRSQMQHTALNIAFGGPNILRDSVGLAKMKQLQANMPNLPVDGRMSDNDLYDFQRRVQRWYEMNGVPA